MRHSGAKSRHGDGNVKHGSRAKIHFQVAAYNALQSCRIREISYGHGTQYAAVLAGIDADQIATVGTNGLERVRYREDGFIEHDGNASSGTQARTAMEISAPQRLLESIDVELLECGERLGGLAFCPAGIGVDGD